MSRIKRGRARRRWAWRPLEFALLLIAAIVVLIAMVSLKLSQGEALGVDLAWVVGGFIGVFTLAHLVVCAVAPHADQIMLPLAATANGLGLIMISRIDAAEGTSMASRQVLWTFVGVVLMTAVLIVIRDHRVLARYSYLLGIIGLILLALPMVWPLGQEANADAKIWISLGPFSVQPGEFSKILLLLFFAQLLTTKRTLFTGAGKKILGLELPRLRDLAPLLVVWGIALVLMAGENDFGPALLLFGTVLVMTYLATARPSWLVIGIILVALGGYGVYKVSSKIQVRVANFLDPLADYNGNGRQLAESLFGMSYGGITGRGLGKGYPELVPVVHSDFILAAFGEELGFLGIAGILLLFAVFITRGFVSSLLISDAYGKLVAAGLSVTLAIQLFVVVGGISGMIPMTGLTTPFMSQGGSSLMANYILLALLLRISHTARAELEDAADVVVAASESISAPPLGGVPGKAGAQ